MSVVRPRSQLGDHAHPAVGAARGAEDGAQEGAGVDGPRAGEGGQQAPLSDGPEGQGVPVRVLVQGLLGVPLGARELGRVEDHQVVALALTVLAQGGEGVLMPEYDRYFLRSWIMEGVENF